MSKVREDQGPLIKFFRFIPSAREPQRADRSAAGSMPMRAYRYCEAMTTASAFGWYVFPPMTFSLMWDGRMEVLWNYEDKDDWFLAQARTIPQFRPPLRQVAPAEVSGYSPPFLGAFKDPGRADAVERIAGADRAGLGSADPSPRQSDRTASATRATKDWSRPIAGSAHYS